MVPFFMAWGMFTIIPCPYKKWDSEKYPEMLISMPFIGLIVGVIWAAVSFLLVNHTNPLLAFAAAAVLPWVLTGFIHLDGYMDCADAVLSRRERSERLRILKDSHVGSFAVIMMVILAIVQFASGSAVFTMNESQFFLLVLIPAVSRSLTAAAVLNLTPLPTSSYARMFANGVPTSKKRVPIILAVIFIVIGFLAGGIKAISLLVLAAAYFLTLCYLKKDLGGMSGDISGACITISEAAALAALAAMVYI